MLNQFFGNHQDCDARDRRSKPNRSAQRQVPAAGVAPVFALGGMCLLTSSNAITVTAMAAATT
mgnify:CR=1 FL=1